jgi:pyridoxamine 5'-phosphate oxidase
MKHPNLAALRENYTLGGLLEADAAPDPFTQFHRWFDEALAVSIQEPNAMSLATVSPAGTPSLRIVLLKDINMHGPKDEQGFTFFTNYNSRKGQDLAHNPAAALCFHWRELERQVRIEGSIEKLPREQSESYFRSRPRSSQIGAWVSSQSTVIASRETLDQAQRLFEERFAGQDVPLPDFWGGYLLRPVAVEFWQGRPSRLHDRLLYHQDEASQWRISRLSP